MKVALRVLKATAAKQHPAQADIDTLVRLNGPKAENAGWDEFACDVLQRIMRDRATARKPVVRSFSF